MSEIIQSCRNCFFKSAYSGVTGYKKHRECIVSSNWGPDYETAKSMVKQREEVIAALDSRNKKVK